MCFARGALGGRFRAGRGISGQRPAQAPGASNRTNALPPSGLCQRLTVGTKRAVNRCGLISAWRAAPADRESSAGG